MDNTNNPYARLRPVQLGKAMREELTKQTRQGAKAMRDLSKTYRTNTDSVTKQYPTTDPVFELAETYSSLGTDSDDEVVFKTKNPKKKRSTGAKSHKRRVSMTPMKRTAKFNVPSTYTPPTPTQTQDTDDTSEVSVSPMQTPVKRHTTPVKRQRKRTRPAATPVKRPGTPTLTLTCDIHLGPSALATIAARVEEIFLKKMMSTLED
jgi:hypothetical protein